MDKTTLNNIRELYNNVVWTHKIQEKESDILHKKQIVFNILSIILLSLTSSGILSTIFINEIVLKIISAVISFISLTISIITLSTNYDVLASQHKASALDFLCLRNNLKVFLTDIKIERYSIEEILLKRDDFYNKYNTLCKNSLSASNKAVTLAQKDIEGELLQDE